MKLVNTINNYIYIIFLGKSFPLHINKIIRYLHLLFYNFYINIYLILIL